MLHFIKITWLRHKYQPPVLFCTPLNALGGLKCDASKDRGSKHTVVSVTKISYIRHTEQSIGNRNSKQYIEYARVRPR